MQIPRLLFGAVTLAMMVPVQSRAQAAADKSNAPAVTPAGPHPIGLADIKAWNTIRQTALSPDGKWFAYVIGPQEGNLTLIVRSTAEGASESRIPVGESGGSIVISAIPGGWATSWRRLGSIPRREVAVPGATERRLTLAVVARTWQRNRRTAPGGRRRTSSS
jgi:hypothetical protein